MCPPFCGFPLPIISTHSKLDLPNLPAMVQITYLNDPYKMPCSCFIQFHRSTLVSSSCLPRMANTSLPTIFMLILLAISALYSLAAAQDKDARKPYIVHIIKPMKPPHFTSHQHWYASMLRQVSQSDDHNATELLYIYDTLLHGFAAMLSRAEAAAMESVNGCIAVIPSSVDKIATTQSPEFLGLASSSGLWSQGSTYGKDIIVGMIDTGIWPESKSFDGQGLGPFPTRWKGTCESGLDFNSSHCNSKIIGARTFFKGYEKMYNTRINESSPRDTSGHGTHTASTVAGVAVPSSSFFGFANGTARGMAPQARLAIYKACWSQGCVDADTLAAMEQAIADGVDIISISIGSSDVPFHRSPRAIAAFGAIQKGVLVSAAAGNDGPFVSTLHNTAPWITTVGASSIDRDFPASIVLGNEETYRGTSTFKGRATILQRPNSVVYVSSNSSTRRCLAGSLDPNVVKSKIVVCDQLLFSNNEGETNALVKGNVVAKAGGVGMIVANENLLGQQQRFTNPNNLPAISVSFTVGEKIKAYINSTGNDNATATMNITGLTVVGNGIAAPIVAAFSSRGPSAAYLHVLKPDMIAPGVNILAAYAPGLDYFLESGTSMACPHVSGIVALIKSIHPSWSPAAIKSALMTSSYIVDNTKQPIRDSSTMKAADPFDMGAGHVDPRAAVDPGLVYDMEAQDYISFLCTLNYTKEKIALLTKELISCPNSSLEAGDLNYPSFSVVFDPNSGNKPVQVKRRTVTYVGTKVPAIFQATVKNPSSVNISVEPETLEFRNINDKGSYSVRFESKETSPAKDYKAEFGEVEWKCISGGTFLVRSAVAIIWLGSD